MDAYPLIIMQMLPCEYSNHSVEITLPTLVELAIYHCSEKSTLSLFTEPILYPFMAAWLCAQFCLWL